MPAKEAKRDGNTVVQFYSSRGVRCFRIKKKMPDGRVHIAANFTMKVKRNGRVVYFTLPSTQAAAGVEANRIDTFLDVRSNTLDMAIKEFDPERYERLHPSVRIARVGDVLKAHEAAEKALGLEEPTAKEYRQSLRIVFRQALAHRRKDKQEPTNEEVDLMLMSEFNHRLVSDFKVARVALAGEDRAERETKKRSVNAVARSIRGLFSAEALKHYANLALPKTLDEVIGSMQFARPGKVKKKLPDENIIRAIYEGAGELRKEDPNAYLAFLLAGHAGQRKREIGEAVLDWLEEPAGANPRIWVRSTPNFVAKGKDEGFAEVQPWVIDEIRALVATPSYILSGKMTERTDHVFRRLNTWLDKKGVKGRSVHALRFFFGSYVANRFTLYKAQQFLRHKTAQITSDSYSDIMLNPEIYVLWEERPAWAVAEKAKATA